MKKTSILDMAPKWPAQIWWSLSVCKTGSWMPRSLSCYLLLTRKCSKAFSFGGGELWPP